MIVDQTNIAALQNAEVLEDNYEKSGFQNGDDVSMSNGKASPILVDSDQEPTSSNNESFHHDKTGDISIITID